MESLDDVVYYLKATIHSLELISALFVVGAGIKVNNNIHSNQPKRD
jgi:hypothetical protein